MLHAHKFLDGLRRHLGADNGSKVHIFAPFPERDAVLSPAEGLIAAADKFDFGCINSAVGSGAAPCIGVVGDGTYDAGFPEAALTPDEVGMWVDGLIPLPHKYCWYEWSSSGDGYRNMALVLLITDDEMKLVSDRPVEQQETTESWLVAPVLSIGANEYFFAPWTFRLLRHPGGARDGRLLVNLTRVHRLDEFLENAARQGSREKHVAYTMFRRTMDIAASVPFLTLMLNSASTEMRREEAPARLNKKRVAAGKVPLFSHRVVNLVPKRYISYEGEGGTHASPRLHWRRSHIRHYSVPTPRGKQTADGRWAVVIPRCLVGKRELGEVTHEYKVSPGATE